MILGRRIHSPWHECVFGEEGSGTRVVLFGDSHALQWGPAMVALAVRSGWRLTALVKQGCTVADVRFGSDCDRWRRNAIARIARHEDPDLIVVSTGTTRRNEVRHAGERLDPVASLPYLQRGMRRTLHRLAATGARVALIRDQHMAPWPPADCILRRPEIHPNRACRFRATDRRHRYGWDYRAARRTPGVRVIDPNPILCPQGSLCPVVRDGVLMYRDRYHLTATFARRLAPWLASRLPRAAKRRLLERNRQLRI